MIPIDLTGRHALVLRTLRPGSFWSNIPKTS